LVGTDGVFVAAFSGSGAPVALSAPGVAVVSTVPGGQAALDGTGIAAAGVTGLAALVLAHHPVFQGPLRAHIEQRVGTLFQLLYASAVPYFADPLRASAGVPSLRRVPGLLGVAEIQSVLRPAAVAGQGPPFTQPNWPIPELLPGSLQGWQAYMQMRAAGLI
jgi:subtilisin family serine protease